MDSDDNSDCYHFSSPILPNLCPVLDGNWSDVLLDDSFYSPPSPNLPDDILEHKSLSQYHHHHHNHYLQGSSTNDPYASSSYIDNELSLLLQSTVPVLSQTQPQWRIILNQQHPQFHHTAVTPYHPHPHPYYDHQCCCRHKSTDRYPSPAISGISIPSPTLAPLPPPMMTEKPMEQLPSSSYQPTSSSSSPVSPGFRSIRPKPSLKQQHKEDSTAFSTSPLSLGEQEQVAEEIAKQIINERDSMRLPRSFPSLEECQRINPPLPLFPEIARRRQTRPRGRKDTDPKKKRPLNSFMMYRKFTYRQVRDELAKIIPIRYGTRDSKAASRIIGKMWTCESQEIQLHYYRLAEEAKAILGPDNSP